MLIVYIGSPRFQVLESDQNVSFFTMVTQQTAGGMPHALLCSGRPDRQQDVLRSAALEMQLKEYRLPESCSGGRYLHSMLSHWILCCFHPYAMISTAKRRVSRARSISKGRTGSGHQRKVQRDSHLDGSMQNVSGLPLAGRLLFHLRSFPQSVQIGSLSTILPVAGEPLHPAQADQIVESPLHSRA